MAACKSCGADASGIACEFCGAVQRQPVDLSEELAALDAVAKAAQHVSASVTGKGTGLGGHKMITERMMRNNALAGFWSGAYMPASPDALIQAATLALSGVQANKSGGQSQDQLNAALLSRAHAAATALSLRAPTDTRVATLRQAITDTEARMQAGALTAAKQVKDFLPVFGVLGLIFAVLALKNIIPSDSDAPIPTTMQGAWTRSDSTFNYSLRVAETSISLTPSFATSGQPSTTVSKIHQRGQGGLQEDGTFAFHAEYCESRFALMDTNTLVVSEGCGNASGTWARSP